MDALLLKQLEGKLNLDKDVYEDFEMYDAIARIMAKRLSNILVSVAGGVHKHAVIRFEIDGMRYSFFRRDVDIEFNISDMSNDLCLLSYKYINYSLYAKFYDPDFENGRRDRVESKRQHLKMVSRFVGDIDELVGYLVAVIDDHKDR